MAHISYALVHFGSEVKELGNPFAQAQNKLVIGLEFSGSLHSLREAFVAHVCGHPFPLAGLELSIDPYEWPRLTSVLVEVDPYAPRLERLHDVKQFAHADQELVDADQVVDGGVDRLLAFAPKLFEIVDGGGVVYSHCLSVRRGVVYSRAGRRAQEDFLCHHPVLSIRVMYLKLQSMHTAQ